MENNPATIIKEAVEGLSKDIRFAAGEIATFKEASCSIAEKINESSNKLLLASTLYFIAILLLTGVIAFAAMIQAGIIKF